MANTQVTTGLKADGNPEGKGLSEFLRDRIQSSPRNVVAKPRRRLLNEFFSSMLVLSAEFKFRPVVGSTYYLYCGVEAWSLSLIRPIEWSSEKRRDFVASCVLQADMTWAISPSERISENSRVTDEIGEFYDAFAGMLDTDSSLEEILPFYVGRLPYYQRMYASALSRSLYASLLLGDQIAISGRHWCRLAPLAEHRIAQLR